MSAAATAQARTLGPATPVPENWVTPIVVTATPLPLNSATAQAEILIATAIALTTGTPTPTPNNVQTATSTPAFTLIEPILQPTFTPIASPMPVAMPSELIGKILFLSDRESSDEQGVSQVYVFDLTTKQLGRLTARWPYDLAVARDSWSADQRFRIFTKDAIRYKNIDPAIPGGDPSFEREDIPALYWSDSLYNAEEQLTHFGAGIAFEGAWSPTSEQIVFVSNDSADDDIWIVNRDGSGLKQLTDDNRAYNAREIGKDTFIPEVNRRPSFSPDGQQIVFFSTRSGNYQLWVMNRDGSEQQILMDWTPYNDWDPVWVKYPDLAPILPTDQ
jgi:Tol biopolymer transport system component